jgi:exodeoxyribonuclease VII small subunit
MDLSEPELDYEQARDELTSVVAKLEAGGLSLEDSLALWERGEVLAKICDGHLAGARERIESALAAVEDQR